MKAFVVAVAFLVPLAVLAADQEPAWRISQGNISAIQDSGSSFSMKDAVSGQTLTFQTDTNTKVKLGTKSDLVSLKNDDEATVIYSRSGNKNLVAQITDMKVLRGKIESADDSSITIQNSDNKSETLKLNTKTSVTVGGKTAKSSQLKKGSNCAVAYEGTEARYIDSQ